MKTVISFEGLGPCFYTLGEFRPPRKGEFYLSGAVVQGWRAPNDLSTAYRIAIPTRHAMEVKGHKPGDPVKL